LADQWEKVHVFISSTFNDMHAERDYLVKRVFPELQDWCEKRKLRLIEVDLRWGVTEEDATRNINVVRTCLKRIDDCRPFFICLLGQRYGWIPGKSDVSEKTLEDFPRLESSLEKMISITEMEILHAIVQPYNEPKPQIGNDEHTQHAFFYLRDDDYLKDLPDSPAKLKKIYADADKSRELKRLKEEIISATGRPARRYHTRWDHDSQTPELTLPLQCPALLEENVAYWQSDWQNALKLAEPISGREVPVELTLDAAAYNERLTQGRLTDFMIDGRPLHEVVLEDLKAAISQRYPTHREVRQATDLQEELDQHEVFLFNNSEGFIERGNDFEELDAYLDGKSRDLFVLTADGGIGKSMLLAKWVDRCRKDPTRARTATFHTRFIGQSDRSNTVSGLLYYLLKELQENTHKISSQEIPVDPSALRLYWREQLQSLTSQGKTVFVIDAINEFETGLSDLSWIPLAGLPENVKFIISFRTGEDKANDLYQKYAKNNNITLSHVVPFDDPQDRRLLVEDYLSNYLKELDSQHIEQLISAEGANNPLFLKVVLSELRVFGAFAQLTAIIKNDFGTHPESAFMALLQRLEKDPVYSQVPPEDSIPLFFGLLLHARHGLTAIELTTLLQKNLPDMSYDWHEVYESVQLILRQVKSFIGRREGRYYLFFESFQNAVRDRYVRGTSGEPKFVLSAKTWHQLLADFFAEQPLYYMVDVGKAANRRKLAELPFQQAHANAWEGLRATLTDFNFISAKMQIGWLENLMQDYEIAMTEEYPERDLSLVQDAIQMSVHVIQKDPAQTTSQLIGRLFSTEHQSIRKLIEQCIAWDEQPWLRPIISALGESGTALKRTISGFPHAILAMTHDQQLNQLIVSCADHSLSTWDLEHFEMLETVTLPQNVDATIDSQLDLHAAMRISGMEGGLADISKQTYFGAAAIVVIPNTPHVLLNIIRDMSLWIWDREKRQRVSLLRGHRGMVIAAKVTSDGRYALSSSSDATIRIWDIRQKKAVISPKFTLAKHTNWVTCLAITEDNRFVVSGSTDKTIRIWEIETGKHVRSINTGDPVGIVTVTPDNQYIVSATPDGKVFVWEFEPKAKGLKALMGSGKVYELIGLQSYPIAILPIGEQKILTAGSKEGLQVWDLETGKKVTDLANDIKSTNVMLSAVLNPVNKMVLEGGTNRVVKLFNYDLTFAPPQALKHPGFSRCVAVSPDGRYSISGTVDGEIHVWDIQNQTLKHELKGHTDIIRDVALSRDGKRLISGGHDKTVRVWDWMSGDSVAVFKEDALAVYSVGISDDGHNAISGGEGQVLRVWDIEQKKPIREIPNNNYISAVGLTGDGESAISAIMDGTVRINRSLNQGMAELLFSMLGSNTSSQSSNVIKYEGIINAFSVSRDGKKAVSGDRDGKFVLWDLENNTFEILCNEPLAVWGVAFVYDHPDWCYCSRGTLLELWNIPQKRVQAQFTADAVIHDCAVNHAGDLVVSNDIYGTLYIHKLMAYDLKG